MKRLCLILFVLLLLAAPAMAEEPLQLARMSGPMLGSGGSAAAASCSSSNDSTQWQPTTDGSTTSTVAFIANKFTIDSAITLTGYIVKVCDAGSDAGNIEVVLYQHHVSDAPDLTAGPISGTSATKDTDEFSNCASADEEEVLLSVTYELDAGTYWVASKERNSAAVNWIISNGGSAGDRLAYNANVADPETLSYLANSAHYIRILGCN